MAIQTATVSFTAEAGPKTGTFLTPSGNYVKTAGAPVVTDGGGPVAIDFSAADSPSGGTTTFTLSASGAFTGSVTIIVADAT